MNPVEIICRKRDGAELSDEEIEYMVSGMQGGYPTDYQLTAWAMAVFFQGMSFRETVALTRSMRDSGKVLQWDLPGPCVDKHSTGGIGDKISIPLAPALAACGAFVPMISGRGLGPTGGTLDKLESIRQLKTNLSTREFSDGVQQVGCIIAAATEDIAPADKAFYALRDVSGTVPSIPLITASILSKKLAEGVQTLVLDVKCGAGAFMKSVESATQLASSLVRVAAALGTQATAVITRMNEPLGQMIGNSVEIEEALDILRGLGPADVRELTCHLGGVCLAESKICQSIAAGKKRIANVLDSGSALEHFEQMIRFQGGDLNSIVPREKTRTVPSMHTGFVRSIDSEQLGFGLVELGGGRKTKTDQLNHGVGIHMRVRPGDHVQNDQPLLELYSNRQPPAGLIDKLRQAIEIGESPQPSSPLILKTLSVSDLD